MNRQLGLVVSIVAAGLLTGGQLQAAQTGLVGHWQLDETSGSVAADSSANSNSGVLVNCDPPLWSPSGGYLGGNCLGFDGLNDYVNCGADATLNTGSMSVAFWMSADVCRAQVPMDKLPADTGYGWSIKLRPDGAIWVRVGSEFGADTLDAYGPAGAYVAGSWNHIAATFDQQTIRLYVDGVERANQAFARTLDAGSTQVWIGGCSKPANEPFQGRIQDVRLYDRALSAMEVFDLLSAEGKILCEYWTGIGGSTLSDLTGNANYPHSPSGLDYPTAFELPGWGDSYGQRFRGYVYPPQTGEYVFWIASDDASQLWLSSDDDPANVGALPIASIPDAQYTNTREWTKFASQQSVAITLTSGQRYYIEALHKEGGGGDHIEVRWQLPDLTIEDPIPSNRLSPYSPTPAITSASPAGVLLGASYGHTFAATWSPTWTLADAADLPAGLTWDAGTATISGVATAVGISNQMTVTATNAGGQAQQQFTIQVFEVGDGLTGAYYSNKDLAGDPMWSRVDAQINFGFVSQPGQDLPADNFSVRWTGAVLAPYTETYTFWTCTDDGVRLWVNGQLLIDKWVDQGTVWWYSSIALTAGQKYDLVMEFYENGGGEFAVLHWESPSIGAAALVPQASLFSTLPPSIISAAPEKAYVGAEYSYAVAFVGHPTPALTVAGLPQWLAFDGTALISGTPAAGDLGLTGTITATVTSTEGQDAQEFGIEVAEATQPAGTILREWWEAYAGSANALLAANAPAAPTGRESVASFDGPVNWMDSYGSRMRGYVHPPVTGDYVFKLCSDDDSELWLSSDEDPANAVKIVEIIGSCSLEDWGHASSPITLQMGPKYYIEVVHREGGGGDHVRVGWVRPGSQNEYPIPGTHLSPWGDTPAITTTPPAGCIVGELYTYTAAATGYPAPSISATGLPGWLAFDSTDTISGTPEATDVGLSAAVTVTATNYTGTDEQTFQVDVNFPAPPPAEGRILYEKWQPKVGDGTDAAALNISGPGAPTSSEFHEVFGTGENVGGDEYQSRYRGYVYPPHDGMYTFFLSSDDDSQLWLSTDDSPENLVKIAELDGWCSYDSWDASSSPVALDSSRRYYVEAVQQDGNSGDHLRVGWTRPDGAGATVDDLPIMGADLSPWSSSPLIGSAVADDPDNGENILSAGDTLTITFDVNTNQPPVTTKLDIDGLVSFGADSLGADYTGSWANAYTLVITVVDAAGGDVALGGAVSIIADGSDDLLNAAQTSAASASSRQITGDWGHTIATGLTGHWRLDELSGLVAYDSSEERNDGALRNMVGTEWTTGTLGGACQLDGADDHIEMMDDADYAHGCTVAAWVNVAATGTPMSIVRRTNGEAWCSNHEIRIDATGTAFEGFIWDGTHEVATGTTAIQAGTWYHVALVSDNTGAGAVRLFINGVQEASAWGGSIGSGEDRWVIGFESHVDGVVRSNFEGQVDDVRVYARTLSLAEIADLSDLRLDTTAPSAPASLEAEVVGAVNVQLTWSASTDDVEVAEYRIYRQEGTQDVEMVALTTHTSYTDTRLLFTTAYTYSVTACDPSSNISNASPEAAITTGGAPFVGTGDGLAATYYDNMDFTGTEVETIDTTVDFDWGGGAPRPEIDVDSFSVVWTGQVMPYISDTYTFHTFSDDGVRLYVAGKLVVDNWTDHGLTEDTGTVVLAGGIKYPIRMEYYENGGDAVAKLQWSASAFEQETIPTTQLYSAGPTLEITSLPEVSPGVLGSAVSPAWVEGNVCLDATSIEVTADVSPCAVTRENQSRWFADNASPGGAPLGITLSETQATNVVVTASADGQVLETAMQSIIWTPTCIDSDSSQSITIRKGDSLLLVTEETTGTLKLDLDYDAVTFDADRSGAAGAPIPGAFDLPGEFTVRARVDDGSGDEFAGEMTVVVIEVEPLSPIACQIGYVREKLIPIEPAARAAEVAFSAFDACSLGDVSVVEYGTVEVETGVWKAGPTITLRVLALGAPVLAARVNGPVGPIAAYGEVDAFALDNSAAYLIHLDRDDTGAGETHGAHLTMDPLVPDPNIDLQITMRSPGMTFENGTSSLAFTAADFILQADGSGVYGYTIYVAPGHDFFCMDTYVEQHHSPGHQIGERVGDNADYCYCQVEVDGSHELGVGDTADYTAALVRCLECVERGHTGEEFQWTASTGLGGGSGVGSTVALTATIGERYGVLLYRGRCLGCDTDHCDATVFLIRIKAPPHALATANPTNGNLVDNGNGKELVVTFDGSTSHDRDDRGTIVKYMWDLDGVALGSGSIIQHTFTMAEDSPPTAQASVNPTSGDVAVFVQFSGDGEDLNSKEYGVKLTVTDDDTLKDDATVNVTVNDPGPVTYGWDFGDGTGSTLKDPPHIYFYGGDEPPTVAATPESATGPAPLTVAFVAGASDLNPYTYNATLTVTDSTGNSTSDGASVDVTEPLPVDCYWDFGDGKISHEANPTHTFEGLEEDVLPTGSAEILSRNGLVVDFHGEGHDLSSHTYEVSLVVVDVDGNLAEQMIPVTVEMDLDVTYHWSFGDGQASIDQDPTHTYDLPGSYTVVLTITDADGHSVTVNLVVVVDDYAVSIGGQQVFCMDSPRDAYGYMVADISGDAEFDLANTGFIIATPGLLYRQGDASAMSVKVDVVAATSKPNGSDFVVMCQYALTNGASGQVSRTFTATRVALEVDRDLTQDFVVGDNATINAKYLTGSLSPSGFTWTVPDWLTKTSQSETELVLQAADVSDFAGNIDFVVTLRGVSLSGSPLSVGCPAAAPIPVFVEGAEVAVLNSPEVSVTEAATVDCSVRPAGGTVSVIPSTLDASHTCVGTDLSIVTPPLFLNSPGVTKAQDSATAELTVQYVHEGHEDSATASIRIWPVDSLQISTPQMASVGEEHILLTATCLSAGKEIVGPEVEWRVLSRGNTQARIEDGTNRLIPGAEYGLIVVEARVMQAKNQPYVLRDLYAEQVITIQKLTVETTGYLVGGNATGVHLEAVVTLLGDGGVDVTSVSTIEWSDGPDFEEPDVYPDVTAYATHRGLTASSLPVEVVVVGVNITGSAPEGVYLNSEYETKGDLRLQYDIIPDGYILPNLIAQFITDGNLVGSRACEGVQDAGYVDIPSGTSFVEAGEHVVRIIGTFGGGTCVSQPIEFGWGPWVSDEMDSGNSGYDDDGGFRDYYNRWCDYDVVNKTIRPYARSDGFNSLMIVPPYFAEFPFGGRCRAWGELKGTISLDRPLTAYRVKVYCRILGETSARGSAIMGQLYPPIITDTAKLSFRATVNVGWDVDAEKEFVLDDVSRPLQLEIDTFYHGYDWEPWIGSHAFGGLSLAAGDITTVINFEAVSEALGGGHYAECSFWGQEADGPRIHVEKIVLEGGD